MTPAAAIIAYVQAAIRGNPEELQYAEEALKQAFPSRQVLQTRYDGAKVRHFRQGRGMTQEQLAEKAGLSRAAVAGIETGAAQLGKQRAGKLAAALQIEVSELQQ